jgi:hypothetical protein
LLAPDSSVLSTTTATDPAKLAAIIRTKPPLLTKRITDRRPVDKLSDP